MSVQNSLFETDSLRLWDTGDDIAIISFKTKLNTCNNDVLKNIQVAVAQAEKTHRGIVLWQDQGKHFSAGADLSKAVALVTSGQAKTFMAMIANFQRASLALRYSTIPTVAAIKGYTFGGGCELALHCSRIVAASDTIIGLVESRVGLLPAGGGCVEYARRARAASTNEEEFYTLFEKYFRNIAFAKASQNAAEAKALGYLQDNDVIVDSADELLSVAKQQIAKLNEKNYHPPEKKPIQVAGESGIAFCEKILSERQAEGKASDHDVFIGGHIARVICGGQVAANTYLDEQVMLDLELDHFLALIQTEKSQARVTHILETGKPLRN